MQPVIVRTDTGWYSVGLICGADPESSCSPPPQAAIIPDGQRRRVAGGNAAPIGTRINRMRVKLISHGSETESLAVCGPPAPEGTVFRYTKCVGKTEGDRAAFEVGFANMYRDKLVGCTVVAHLAVGVPSPYP